MYDINPVPPLTADIAVPDHTPDVITPLECPTPDIEEKFVADVHNEPPTPAPPVIIKDPVDELVDAVEPVTLTVLEFTVVADNVESEIKLDEGLNVSPVSEETATPLPPFVGENKT